MLEQNGKVTGSDEVVAARGVTKSFGADCALSGLDLIVRRGECVGLLGPNGAGKSTFIGCLFNVVIPDGGSLRVFGMDPQVEARRIKARIGVVPQENALDEGLTVMENMRVYARFCGYQGATADHRITTLLQGMSLAHKSAATIKTLSGGMKRRLAFVRALLSDPELLILDEPTTGLDPAVRHVLWRQVDEFHKAGGTVLVTTHYMHEAEVLCDRVVILNRGQIVRQGSPAELVAGETPGFVALFASVHHERIEKLARQSELDVASMGRGFCVRAATLEDLLRLQKEAGVEALQMRPANLEDVYLKLTGRELGDED